MEIVNKKEYCGNLFQRYQAEKECFSDHSVPLEENKLLEIRPKLESCLDDCLVYFSSEELDEMEFDNMFSDKFRARIEQETKKRALENSK